VCLPTKELFNNNSYAHDDEGDNPRAGNRGLMVSSKNCDHCWHLNQQRQGASRANVV